MTTKAWPVLKVKTPTSLLMLLALVVISHLILRCLRRLRLRRWKSIAYFVCFSRNHSVNIAAGWLYVTHVSVAEGRQTGYPRR